MDKNTATTLLLAHMMNGGAFDYAKIASKLAAEDPIMFARLAGIGLVDDTRWESKVIGFMKKNEKVSAIKELRVQTGMGLKESKDTVDYYQSGASTYLTWEGMAQCSRDAVRQLRDYSGNQFL
jgi:hypothetical protein